MTTYNPSTQLEVVRAGDEVCHFGEFPTLGMVRRAYGEEAAAMWLVPQLYNLSEYCGCKEKLQGVPLEECAGVIATEFYYLKVSELMLFFHRFKAGKYGRFYGSVDPLVITTALRSFLRERIYAIDRRAHEERQRKEDEQRRLHPPITYEEYERRKAAGEYD